MVLREPGDNLDMVQLIHDVRVVKAIDASGGAYGTCSVINDTDCCGDCTNDLAEAWEFPNMVSGKGESGYITKARIESETESITPKLTLYLFKQEPTPADLVRLADGSINNSPCATNIADYIGKIDWPALETIGTESYSNQTVPASTGTFRLPFRCAPTSRNLYGILVSRDAFTQTAGDDIIITLTVEEMAVREN